MRTNPITRWLAFCLGFYAVLGLAGCATYGDIDTARKAAVVANAEVRGGYLLLEELVQNRAVSAAQAREIQSTLDDANEAVKSAFRAVQAGGDPTQAATSLERANAILDVALSLLGQYAGPPD